MIDRCICCGAEVPEWRQVCPACERSVTIKPDGKHELEPHIYGDVEIYRNVTVIVSKCIRCGKVEIGWLRQENTEEVEA